MTLTFAVLYNSEHDRSKVALICGGGSGHEPAHAGYVAAVCGAIFASPNPSQVRRGIDLVENEKGGLAGTVLVYKIAGALAQRGGDLEEVYKIAEYVSSRLATIGVGLEHCHVPGTAIGASHLKHDEIEIGMGIHNEPGNRRIHPVPPLEELVPQLVENLTSTDDEDRSFVPFTGKNDRVVLLVNNLGGTSELELGAVVFEAKKDLEKRGIKVERVLSGTFMTSLNMPGFSLTLLLLPSSSDPDAPDASLILSLLDDPANVPAWKWTVGTEPADTIISPVARSQDETAKDGAHQLKAADSKAFISAVQRACNALIAEEPEITRMDNIAGDGDCGLTLRDGAQAVLEDIKSGKISGEDVFGSVIAVSKVAEEQMGGTSGALYSIFFSALAQPLKVAASEGVTTVDPALWSLAVKQALDRLYTYTRARPPSRTLVDPLQAFVETFTSSPNVDFAAAVKAAGDAALKTRDLTAKAGRSAYVEGDRLKLERVPDPGAWGVKAILEGLQGGGHAEAA
ncbi:hypothetical protein PHLCEN_2v4857 [Hermanssonia centrifuga]|uniref:Dihydroxyacetone kinase n=1 Tax=Hermanssonia centrifuga TaxID=98765 RepID=A0A2R6PG18_9APHY|nr:hypothetical protein PHLCEN_2v4857 [Hermanssonia centrifuga]